MSLRKLSRIRKLSFHPKTVSIIRDFPDAYNIKQTRITLNSHSIYLMPWSNVYTFGWRGLGVCVCTKIMFSFCRRRRRHCLLCDSHLNGCAICMSPHRIRFYCIHQNCVCVFLYSSSMVLPFGCLILPTESIRVNSLHSYTLVCILVSLFILYAALGTNQQTQALFWQHAKWPRNGSNGMPSDDLLGIKRI